MVEYESVLREVLPRVNETDAELIKAALARVSFEFSDLLQMTNLTQAAQLERDDAATDRSVTVPLVGEAPADEESGEESEASGGAGSTGALDNTKVTQVHSGRFQGRP